MSDSLNQYFSLLQRRSSDFGVKLKPTGKLVRESTPLDYVTDSGVRFVIPPKEFVRLNYSKESYKNVGDLSQLNFKYTLDDYNKYNPAKNQDKASDGGPGDKSWEKVIDQNAFRLQTYPGTPYDNEDPVYFGFEIIIDVQNSPLFNGELEKFIDKFKSENSEINERIPLINQFKNEIQRYFKFNTSIGLSEGYDVDKLIWSTNKNGGSETNSKFLPTNRIYYVKKVSGLNNLTESNSLDTISQFVDYPKQKITLTFYEDVTLNIGTLASLYKSIYWSRLRGKNIIPENLLRFDFEIILLDLRNLVRINKVDNILEFFKDNLSRYRYKLYECQFWFANLPHPDDVDMSVPPTSYDNYTVDISYKFSSMKFERYEPPRVNGVGGDVWKILDNTGSVNDQQVTILSENRQGKVLLGKHDRISSQVGITFSTIPARIVNVVEEPSALTRFLDNLRSAGLREAQLRLNDRFRLLNNSIDRVRNSFGIGRIQAPTNVYDIPNNGSRIFYDVQNSLRQFGGDILLNTLNR